MNLSPPAFSLRQLQYVVAVAEERSFRRAAELCHVSQPSLSAQLAELEDALGVRLFERDKRRVLLTAAGEELVQRARKVLCDAEDFGLAARRLGDPFAGTLRLGVIPTVSPYLLPEIVPVLSQQYPKLTVVWVEEKTPVLVKLLSDGQIEAALLALEAELGEVESAVIAKDPFMLACASTHPLAKETTPLALNALEDESILLLDEGHCLREQALSFCSAAGVKELGFRATSLSTLAQMVASGMGVTLLPQLSVPIENRRGELTVRPFVEPSPARTLALVWRPHSPIRSALEALAKTLREAWLRIDKG